LIDIHDYPGPESPQPEADRAAALGEFGGLGLRIPGHTWSSNSWGYQPMPDQKTLTARYRQLLDQVHILHRSVGLSAAIYTQLTDVETECNGLMTYDRALSKLDPKVLLTANRGKEGEIPFRIIASNGRYGRITWSYTTDKPDDQWMKPDFNDSNWKEGIGGFGTAGTPAAIVGTTWDTGDIWLRRKFTLHHEDLSNAMIQFHHDEDAQIYLNGVLALQAPSFATDYTEAKIDPAAAATLKPGINLMAIHCHQTTGGQFIDAGIVVPKNPSR
jgi:hypothetical protein